MKDTSGPRDAGLPPGPGYPLPGLLGLQLVAAGKGEGRASQFSVPVLQTTLHLTTGKAGGPGADSMVFSRRMQTHKRHCGCQDVLKGHDKVMWLRWHPGTEKVYWGNLNKV